MTEKRKAGLGVMLLGVVLVQWSCAPLGANGSQDRLVNALVCPGGPAAQPEEREVSSRRPASLRTGPHEILFPVNALPGNARHRFRVSTLTDTVGVRLEYVPPAPAPVPGPPGFNGRFVNNVAVVISYAHCPQSAIANRTLKILRVSATDTTELPTDTLNQAAWAWTDQNSGFIIAH